MPDEDWPELWGLKITHGVTEAHGGVGSLLSTNPSPAVTGPDVFLTREQAEKGSIEVYREHGIRASPVRIYAPRGKGGSR